MRQFQFSIQPLLRLVIILGLCGLQISLAESTGSVSGQVVAAIPTPDGALIRWYPGDGVLPSNGFRLRRTANGQESVTEIASPQPKSVVLNAGWMDGKEYDQLVTLFKSSPKSNVGAFNKVLVSLRVLTDAKWSKALGLYQVVTGLKANTKYGFVLSAVNGKTESEMARFQVTTGPTPAVPSPKFEAKAEFGKVTLTWKRPPGDHFVAAYRVYRGRGDAALEVVKPDPFFPDQTSDDPNALLSFHDNALKSGASYRYTLASVDVFGRESARAPIVGVDLQKSLTIKIPELTRVNSLNKRVSLEWTRPDERVESVIVLRGTDPDKPFEPIATLPGNATVYLDSSVVPGQDYYYALAIKSGTLIAGPSLMKTVRIVNTKPPGTPGAFKARAEKDHIQLTWNAVTDPDLWGYIVLRADRLDAPISQYIALNGTPIPQAQYRDTLPAGSTAQYVYRVVAINTSEVRSVPSDPVRGALQDVTAPNAPQLLSATASEGTVTLHFTAGYVPDLAKLEVYRSAGKGIPELIASLEPSSDSYQDRKVKPQVEYTYTLRAVDRAGLRSKASNALAASIIDTSAPKVPEFQAVVLPVGGVKLIWKAEPGVQYIVYRINERGVPVQISDPIGAGVFTDPEGIDGSNYSLRAQDAAGNLSVVSKPVVAR
jgi:fibronectin type 3 domain-containing protein